MEEPVATGFASNSYKLLLLIKSAPRKTAVSVVVSTVSCCPFAWMPAISLSPESASRTAARHLDHRETSDVRSHSSDIDSLPGGPTFNPR